MYWDMKTVRRVESIRARILIPLEEVERGGDPIWESARRHLVRQVQHGAEPLRLHPEDFQIRELSDSTERLMAVVARWCPTRHEAAIHYFEDKAPHVLQMQGHRPLPAVEGRAALQAPLWQSRGTPGEPVSPSYRLEWIPLSGWDDRNRRWIYAPEGVDLSRLEMVHQDS